MVFVARPSCSRMSVFALSAGVRRSRFKPDDVRSMRAIRSRRRSSLVRFSMSVWACPMWLIWWM